MQAKAKDSRDAIMKDYEAEIDLAKSDFPDYSEDESAASKAKVEFDKSFIGTLDPKTGELDGKGTLPENLANYILTHPYVHHQLADAIFKASLTNSDSAQTDVAVLQKEVSSLKERLGKYEDLSSPTATHKVTGEPAGTAAEVKQKLQALMGQP